MPDNLFAIEARAREALDAFKGEGVGRMLLELETAKELEEAAPLLAGDVLALVACVRKLREALKILSDAERKATDEGGWFGPAELCESVDAAMDSADDVLAEYDALLKEKPPDTYAGRKVVGAYPADWPYRGEYADEKTGGNDTTAADEKP